MLRPTTYHHYNVTNTTQSKNLQCKLLHSQCKPPCSKFNIQPLNSFDDYGMTYEKRNLVDDYLGQMKGPEFKT